MASDGIHLTRDEVLLVKGPARVKCYGDASILGMKASEITIGSDKIIPIETSDSCRVVVLEGIYEIRRRDGIGTSIWSNVIDAVLKNKPRKVMIIGANDTGKSTLTAYLSNIMKGRVSVVDGDVGQGDLAPPACIGAARIRKEFFDLRMIKADRYAFIGAISPAGIEELIIKSIKDLVNTFISDLCIINTDGYIDDYGLDYKISLINEVKPDLVAYIGDKERAKRLISKFNDKIVCSNASYICKTPSERESRRLEQYRRFLGSRLKTFTVKRFGIFGKIYDAIASKEYLLLEPLGPAIPYSLLHDMFVGLSLSSELMGFAIIRSIDNNRITLQTEYKGAFDTILLSTIKLDKSIKNEYRIPLHLLL